MSDIERVDPRGDNFDPNTALVTMDLEVLGELAVAVARAWSRHRGVDLPTVRDEDGAVSEDGAVIAQAAWGYVMHTYTQNEFAREVASDLEKIETVNVPEHRSEFDL